MQSDGEKLSEHLLEFGASVIRLTKDIGSRKDAKDAKFGAIGRAFILRSWRLGAMDVLPSQSSPPKIAAGDFAISILQSAL